MNEPTPGRAGCGPTLFRVALVIGTSFIGLAAGTYIGGHYLMEKGQGLAGPAIALGYGVAGAVIAGGLALLAAFLLKGTALKLAGGAALAGALALTLFLFLRVAGDQDSEKSSEADYAGIPPFTCVLEQTVVTDPYLRVKIEVDAARRRWATTGPGPQHQVCRGAVHAKGLKEVAAALTMLQNMAPADLAACQAETGQATQRLVWKMAGDAQERTLDIGPQCLNLPQVGRMVLSLDRLSMETYRIRCD